MVRDGQSLIITRSRFSISAPLYREHMIIDHLVSITTSKGHGAWLTRASGLIRRALVGLLEIVDTQRIHSRRGYSEF